MSADLRAAARPSLLFSYRRPAGRPALGSLARRAAPALIVLSLAAGFVLIGGGSLEVGPAEAKLGLSASEGAFGPFGQACGSWEPGIWPAQLAPCVLWARGEGQFPSAASVRWPSAIAGIILGLLLARRAQRALGTSAGVLFAFCWFGSVGLIDRSGAAGIDLVGGLAVVGAIDRLLTRGSDLAAGLWASLAFLAGGWPPLALIVLVSVVIGRREGMLSWRLLVPPLVTALVWSGWAISESPVAWGAALALPLTQKSAWLLGLGVLALGLPWSPCAALAASRSVRQGWPSEARPLVFGWLQAALASLLAGTVVPGLASAAIVPALAGLAFTSAAVLSRIWSGELADTARRPYLGLLAQTLAFWGGVLVFLLSYIASGNLGQPGLWIGPAVLAAVLLGLAVWSGARAGPRRAFLALSFQLAAAWVALVAVRGGYLASAVPYYRGLSWVLILLALPLAAVAVTAVLRADARRGVVALGILAACLKLAHWGYYVPEWNYRYGQGPWGRAIGQWVPPKRTIYTTHAWPPDLLFAIHRPVRQLSDPRLLAYQGKIDPKFVLLLENEWDYWPKEAPKLVPVTRFLDERGQTRVLARTQGDASWQRISRLGRDE